MSAATTASLNAPVLNVKELRILTSWAEALAEVVFAGSERLETCLADAFAGAPWRVELGVPEPSPRLRAAIAEIGNAARRATAADALPTMSALVAEVEQNGDGVAALSPRALQSRIAARAAAPSGASSRDYARALQVDPSAMHNVPREAFEGMRPALLCRRRERAACSVLRPGLASVCHCRTTRGRVMSIDPNTTAVVLIEYQNDFTSEGGVLHDAVSEVMDKTDMLANSQRVAQAARAAGATVMHALITFASGYGEISSHPYGILKGVVDGNAFVKGSWGAAIVDDLAPAEGDIVVEGKRGLDTFASTNLDFILRSKGITTIALGGFLTNCCVESTMRSGYENGYRVITLSDCVAATSPEEHDNALKYDFPMFSEPMNSTEFITELGG